MATNILNGPEENSGFPHQSLGKSLLNALNSHKKTNVATVDIKSRECYTYADLVEVSQNLASNLRDFGIKKNDIIGIVSENSQKYSVALLASLYLAAPVHLINPGSTEYELKHLLNLSKPKLLFCSKQCSNNLFKAKNDLSFVQEFVLFEDDYVGEEIALYKNLIKKCTRLFYVEEDIDTRTQVAIICNSSGSTGLPKGVMLTHENFRFHLVSSRNMAFQMKEEESVLLFLPFFHIYALQIFNAAFYCGSTLIFFDHFDPNIFLQTIQNYKVEQLYLVPSLINFLVNSPLIGQYDLSSVKYIYSAAAPLLEEDSIVLTKKFGFKFIHQLYGMTETTGQITQPPKSESYPARSCGKLIPGSQLKIVDVDTQASLGANKNGEICCKSNQIMKGYINNVEKTKEVLDVEGFLHTGDIGYYDDNGFIYIVGRIKDMINYKGHKVSPVEIENILLKHPSVKDVAVIGKPDKRAGEVAVGFIVKKEGAVISEKDIFDYLSKFVSDEKRLHGGINFVGVIPKNSGGKILRTELRQMLNEAHTSLLSKY